MALATLQGIATYLFAPEGFLWPMNLFSRPWRWSAGCSSRRDSIARPTCPVGWMLEIYARNAVLLILVAGGLHLRLYATRGQGTKYKYTNKWLATHDPKFLFANQTWDNIFWNLVERVHHLDRRTRR